MLDFRRGDLADGRVEALIRAHLDGARANSAAGCAHALDLAGLMAPHIDFWTMWEEGYLVGMGALKQHAPSLGEVKSMHTVAAARGRGHGRAMLRHIIATARTRGLSRLSLETGAWDYFAPARALYRRHGFVECPPFADYAADPSSVFMTRELSAHDAAGLPLRCSAR